MWQAGDGSDSIDGGSGSADVLAAATGAGEDALEVAAVDAQSALIRSLGEDGFELRVHNVENLDVATGGGGDAVVMAARNLPGVSDVRIDLGEGDDLLGGVWPAALPQMQIFADGGAGSDTYTGPDDAAFERINFEQEEISEAEGAGALPGESGDASGGWISAFVLKSANSDDENDPNADIQIRLDEEEEI
jgi:hypothetical protein